MRSHWSRDSTDCEDAPKGEIMVSIHIYKDKSTLRFISSNKVTALAFRDHDPLVRVGPCLEALLVLGLAENQIQLWPVGSVDDRTHRFALRIPHRLVNAKD